MASFLINPIKRYFNRTNQWFWQTPERSLERAYEAAQTIKAIEDEYFEGQRIDRTSGRYSTSICSYLEAELSQYLNLAKLRLVEFRVSSTVINLSRQITQTPAASRHHSKLLQVDQAAIALEKLRFIDEILNRYGDAQPTPTKAPTPVEAPTISLGMVPRDPQRPQVKTENSRSPRNSRLPAHLQGPNPQLDETQRGFASKTGVLPRSILRTFDRIRRELKPQAEEEIVKSFRSSKTKTIVSIRLILLLILIPLLMQEISKKFVIGPIVDQIRNSDINIEMVINQEIQAEAISAFQHYEEELKFKNLISDSTLKLSETEREGKLREKVLEIVAEQRNLSNNAIKNIFSDFIAFVSFGAVMIIRRQEISLLKSFMDDIIYGLSDSAKAFIIILFTDIFVGFHSPHGWEVILEGISRHLGLPENREFIFLFIATFPVILDTIFKYWIFRYLNQISPSAVATYRNMNE